MKIITSYAPPTFIKPCIVFSTLAHETAVSFIDALNAESAIRYCYQRGSCKMTEFLVLKKHKTPEDAAEYHYKISLKYRNGESDKLWNKGFNSYLKLVEKYKKEILAAGIRL